MQAIEFLTKLKDGIIQVPKEHIANLQSNLRVIILIDEEPSAQAKKPKKKQPSTDHKKATKHATKNKKKEYSPRTLVKTKGFVFNRDEANER